MAYVESQSCLGVVPSIVRPLASLVRLGPSFVPQARRPRRPKDVVQKYEKS